MGAQLEIKLLNDIDQAYRTLGTLNERSGENRNQLQQMLSLFDRIGVPVVAEMVSYPNGIECKMVRAFKDESTGKPFQVDIIKELFGSYFVKAKVTPSTRYYYRDGKKIATDDIVAIKSIVNVCRSIADKVSDVDNVFLSENLSGTFICVGGPRANLLSQLALGYVEEDGDSRKGLVRMSKVLSLKYEYRHNGNVWTIHEDGMTIPHTPELTGSRWDSDYLLISVFPNILYRDSFKEDMIIIFGAANRLGSQAVERLLKDRKILSDICDYVAKEKPIGWQALVKVEVGDDHSRKSRSFSLTLVGCCPISINNSELYQWLSLCPSDFHDSLESENAGNIIHPHIRGNGHPSAEKIREMAVSSGEEKMSRSTRWGLPITAYSSHQQRALTFPTVEAIERAIDLCWEDPDLKGVPHEYADGQTMVVPAEAVPFFELKELQFTVSKILSDEDLPPEELSELQLEYGM